MFQRVSIALALVILFALLVVSPTVSAGPISIRSVHFGQHHASGELYADVDASCVIGTTISWSQHRGKDKGSVGVSGYLNGTLRFRLPLLPNTRYRVIVACYDSVEGDNEVTQGYDLMYGGHVVFTRRLW